MNKKTWWMGGVGGGLCAALLATAYPALGLNQAAAPQAFAPELVRQGAYLAQAGDCIACHTGPQGQAFAGGLAMKMPIGTLYSTNITPDPRYGIGRYTYPEFVRAVRQGVAADGHRLYPAMPYPSYAKVTDQDMAALYAYFMAGVKPVAQANRDNDIPWLLSMRWPLAIWDWLFVKAERFQPLATQDATWNRGAYLVQSLGHCGSCHTPRGLGYQEKALSQAEGDQYLAGAKIDGWYAKSLRGESGPGLGRWSTADIVQLLKTGRTSQAAAFGSMTEVVSHSTQHLTDGDLLAIATYLKSLPPGKNALTDVPPADSGRTLQALNAGDYRQAGAAGYVEFCVTCHRADGTGFSRVFPALAGNPSVMAKDPTSLIHIVLAGGHMATTQHDKLHFAMPAFTQLSDQEATDILNFIRSSWGNRADRVSLGEVASVRSTLPPAHE